MADLVPVVKLPTNTLKNVIDADRFMNPQRCFLCGETVPAEDCLKEPVFGKWLQDEHQLNGMRYAMPDGTTVIPYSELVVTACADCHAKILELELEIKAVVHSGIKAVRNMDQKRLMLWLMKIYYCMFVFDIHQAAKTGSGWPAHAGKLSYLTIGVRLRELIGKCDYDGQTGSIFVFEALPCDEPNHNFFFADAIEQPFFVIRCNNIVITSFMSDDGVMARSGYLEQWPQFAIAEHVRLNPPQIVELTTIFQFSINYLLDSTLSIGAEWGVAHIAVVKPSRLIDAAFDKPLQDPRYKAQFDETYAQTMNEPLVYGPGQLPTFFNYNSGE